MHTQTMMNAPPPFSCIAPASDLLLMNSGIISSVGLAVGDGERSQPLVAVITEGPASSHLPCRRGTKELATFHLASETLT